MCVLNIRQVDSLVYCIMRNYLWTKNRTKIKEVDKQRTRTTESGQVGTQNESGRIDMEEQRTLGD